jgi:hypothetical protein
MATRDVLLRAKCRALVRTRWPDSLDAATEHDLPGGAAIVDPTSSTAFLLAEDNPDRSLGGAIVWARRHRATTLHLLVSGGEGRLARRAKRFDLPITVWRVDGATVTEAEPAVLEPDQAPDPRTEPFIALFERAGATAVAEGGILRAEVRGLEVARVEIDEHTGEPRLAVGVGKHDREAHREVHGDAQTFDALFEVVRIVAEHRVADGAGHAAVHLSPERWLRDVVVRHPELVGANDDLEPRPSPNPRDDLRAAAPAPAAGTDAKTDAPLLVVCSVGTDLDLVPAATDAAIADGRAPQVRFVVPEGDDLPSTRDLVDLLTIPADLVTVPPDWRTR